MTEPLSPAAAAVLKEFEDSWDADPFEMDVRALAAALRAAAKQLDVTNGECPGVTPFEIGFLKGAARCQRDLLAIAVELEG
jgi:hypothetical protein